MRHACDVPSSAAVRRVLPPLAVILAVATGLAIVTIDQPVARALARYEPAALWRDGLRVIDRGTGWLWWKWLPTTIVVAVASVAAVAPRLRRYARGLGAMALVHGATKLILLYTKPGLGRLRPSQWLAAGGDDTFWFTDGVGFPSGHTGHYLSIALPLAVAWPRLGLPLLIVPVFASASRIATDAHFVSDVLGSAALVVALTYVATRTLGLGAARSARDRA